MTFIYKYGCTNPLTTIFASIHLVNWRLEKQIQASSHAIHADGHTGSWIWRPAGLWFSWVNRSQHQQCHSTQPTDFLLFCSNIHYLPAPALLKIRAAFTFVKLELTPTFCWQEGNQDQGLMIQVTQWHGLLCNQPCFSADGNTHVLGHKRACPWVFSNILLHVHPKASLIF